MRTRTSSLSTPRFVLAALASLSIGAASANAQDPNTTPRPSQERLPIPKAPEAQRSDTSEELALNSLQRAHNQFREAVTKTLQNAGHPEDSQFAVEQLTIASIGDGTVVAGAPAQTGHHKPGMNDERRTGKSSTGEDPKRDRSTGSSSSTDDPDRASTKPRPGAIDDESDDSRSSGFGHDERCLGMIVVCENDGQSDALRSGNDRDLDRANRDVPRSKDGTSPESSASDSDVRRTVAVNGKIPSGMYMVKSSGSQVKLYRSGEDSLAVSIPLIEIGKIGQPRTLRPNERRDLGTSDEPTRGDDEMPNSHTGDRTAMNTQEPDWQTVFASVVCALEKKSS